MAKKSRADIMEKLSALNPSEPTRTRGKASRKPAAKPAGAKKTVPPKAPRRAAPSGKPKTQLSPDRQKPAAWPRMEALFPACAGTVIFGDATKMIEGVYAQWFQIFRNCSGAAADCNEMFLRSLSCFVNPGRWWRL
ncbi:MAG: hypothetical protein MUE76_07860 [Syntrophales bacterium]|jgi:hypothetical protein|nr:hypothetical protein [Syntrophales bacterium]